MPPNFDWYEVWKVDEHGGAIRRLKNYKTKSGAVNRADKEAEDEWRSDVEYVVKHVRGREMPPPEAQNVPASRLGIEGVEVQNVVYSTVPGFAEFGGFG